MDSHLSDGFSFGKPATLRSHGELPWLAAFGCVTAALAVALLVTLVPEAAKPMLLLCAGAAAGIALFRFPPAVLVAMLALAPFYDLLRTLFFGDVALAGAWQDLVVIGIGVGGIARSRSHRTPQRWTAIDIAVIVFILAYACSAVLTPAIEVWFYVFRYCTVYAFLYLALRGYTFSRADLRNMLYATTFGLIVSGIAGLVVLNELGEQGYSAAWNTLDMAAYWREGGFRWPATFPNPIIASTAFALLSIVAAAQIAARRARVFHAVILVLAIGACAFTRSRSGWVVAGVGLPALCWASGMRLRLRTVFGVGALAVASGVALMVANPAFLDIVSRKDPTDNERLGTFTLVLEEAFQHPFGVGLGTAGAVAARAQRFAGASVAAAPVVGDSVLLQVLRDTGWIGAFAFATVCAGFVAQGLKAVRASADAAERAMSLTCVGFTAGLLANIMNATDVWPTKFYFWLFGAMVVCICSGRVRRDRVKEPLA